MDHSRQVRALAAFLSGARPTGGSSLARWLLCLALGLVAACGSNAPAPVEDRAARTPAKAPPSHSSDKTYRVQRGDTLYSIAFRYGLDFRKMAAANRIPAPFTIYVGQEIALREDALPATTARPAPKPASSASKPVATKPATARASSAKPAPAKPVATAPAQPSSGGATYTGAAVKTWRWPTSGPVTRGYSGSVHKGIDIGGRRGDPIYAVAPGKVVYAGTGIVGLGELLIIKHNDIYLSAYAHNDRLLVSEGEVVQSGQKVAEKGSSGTDSVKLHFEIRKAGKPINPQRVLPKR